jgi:hypothetical protein
MRWVAQAYWPCLPNHTVHVFTQPGSLADVGEPAADVRFALDSGHKSPAAECPLRANSAHLTRTVTIKVALPWQIVWQYTAP